MILIFFVDITIYIAVINMISFNICIYYSNIKMVFIITIIKLSCVTFIFIIMIIIVNYAIYDIKKNEIILLCLF